MQQGHLLGPHRARPIRPSRFGTSGEVVVRLARAYPRGVVAWAVVAVPAMAVAAALPPPLSWIGWLVAYTIGAGAALGAAALGVAEPGAAARSRPSIRAGLVAAIGYATPLVVGGLLLGSAFVAVVGPMILIVSALEAGWFGAYLVVLATLATLARFPLMLPAIVGRGMPVLDAAELSWDLADGVLVELAALLALLLVATLGPVVAVAVASAALDLPDLAVLGLAGATLAVAGPLLPLVFAALLDPLEARRRDLDPTFGRP